MSHPFDGALAKVNRAKEHLAALEGEIGVFLAGDPFPTTLDADSQTGQYVLRLTRPQPLPTTQWALMLGDCVHNLRAALDYVAWQIAGAGPTDTRTMFPLFLDRKEFARKGRDRIKRLPRAAQDLIESFQPYHAPNPRLTGLGALHVLDNTDKHRLLVLTAAIQDSVEVQVSLPPPPPALKTRPVLELLPNAPVQDGAVLGVVRLIPPVPQAMVTLRGVSFEIAFEEGLFGDLRVYVIDNLNTLVSEVESVIRRFEP